MGAGIGEYVANLADLGWDAQGVELASGAVETAASLGRLVRQGTIFSPFLEEEERFDLVTLWHVLEHLPDPVAALERARALLRPGGRLMLAVPNWQSALRPRVGSAWWALEVPRHLWHFEPDTLQAVLERAGFEVEFVRPKVHGRMVQASRALARSGGPMLVGGSASAFDWALGLGMAVGNRTDTIWAECGVA